MEKAREFQKSIYFCFLDYAKAFDGVDHSKLWKILEEMGIPDHLTCLLRNLYAGQEATVRTGHGTTDWFQIGKGARQGCLSSPCVFNVYAENIMRNAGLEDTHAGTKIAGRTINHLRCADDTTFMAESDRWSRQSPDPGVASCEAPGLWSSGHFPGAGMNNSDRPVWRLVPPPPSPYLKLPSPTWAKRVDHKQNHTPEKGTNQCHLSRGK